MKARAIENQCYVISCNKVGKNEKGILNGGHSVVFDPWGTKLLQLGATESFGVVEIDLNRVEEVRKKFPVLQCRREDLYGMSKDVRNSQSFLLVKMTTLFL